MRDDCWGCYWFNTVGECNIKGECNYTEVEEEEEEA